MQFRFSAFALAVFLSACDGGMHVEGTVLTQDKKPVEGAKIYFDDPGRERYPNSFETSSDSAGHFRLSTTVAPGNYKIPVVVEATGYQTFREELPTLQENTLVVHLTSTGQ